MDLREIYDFIKEDPNQWKKKEIQKFFEIIDFKDQSNLFGFFL